MFHKSFVMAMEQWELYGSTYLKHHGQGLM